MHIELLRKNTFQWLSLEHSRNFAHFKIFLNDLDESISPRIIKRFILHTRGVVNIYLQQGHDHSRHFALFTLIGPKLAFFIQLRSFLMNLHSVGSRLGQLTQPTGSTESFQMTLTDSTGTPVIGWGCIPILPNPSTSHSFTSSSWATLKIKNLF